MLRTIISLIQTEGFSPFVIAIIAAMAVTLLFCLPVHEWAHAYTAYKLGDNTARFKGRMTLNPFAHLNWMGTILMLVAGVGYATAVPVNPLNFKNKKGGMALVSVMGPLSNFVLAFAFMLLGKLVALYGSNFAFAYFFIQLALVNASLMVFNLLPIPPLDGSRILTLFLPERLYFKLMRYEQYIMIGLLVVLYLGVFDPVINFLQGNILSLLDVLTGFIGFLY